MKIESVDLFYLAMPEIRDIGDGSQDMLLVRVLTGGYTGWGECEASPLASIASFVGPMSHSACHPVQHSVLGQTLDSPGDIARITRDVRAKSLDLLQADHTLSGIEMALWDLLGKRFEQPVYELLGYPVAKPKTPYASVLFGDTPEDTLVKARRIRAQGFTALKFGWGSFGRGTPADDADQLRAAREGLGDDGTLMIDAGTVWVEDVEAAALRLPALEEVRVLFLEEPFVAGALRSYRELAGRCENVRIAGGEGSHNAYVAEQFIDHSGAGFVQIDTGRIGGIGDAKRVADYARKKNVQFVNHTFTSHLALSASLQPFAGVAGDWLCEYPMESARLATALTHNRIAVNNSGHVTAPDAPGLGMDLDLEAIREYLVEVDIKVNGASLYSTPELLH
jgi:L-alanine-DL-glutamate epimerase-like enolase superfamily enzyme